MDDLCERSRALRPRHVRERACDAMLAKPPAVVVGIASHQRARARAAATTMARRGAPPARVRRAWQRQEAAASKALEGAPRPAGRVAHAPGLLRAESPAWSARSALRSDVLGARHLPPAVAHDLAVDQRAVAHGAAPGVIRGVAAHAHWRAGRALGRRAAHEGRWLARSRVGAAQERAAVRTAEMRWLPRAPEREHALAGHRLVAAACAARREELRVVLGAVREPSVPHEALLQRAPAVAAAEAPPVVAAAAVHQVARPWLEGRAAAAARARAGGRPRAHAVRAIGWLVAPGERAAVARRGRARARSRRPLWPWL